MSLDERSVPAGADPGRGALRGRAGSRVVSLRGEHDLSTADDLVALFADAMALDDADLVVDLGAVTFMGASTIGALVGLRAALGVQERTLVLSSPSRSARRMIDICGLSDLVEGTADAAPSPTSEIS